MPPTTTCWRRSRPSTPALGVALPDGLDTVVGSGGRELTDAQAQQIALARLVLADPHTLVLDEATSLIDPRAARHLERSLAAVLHGRTVIAIAHRLFSAHDADRVAVVEDGRISESVFVLLGLLDGLSMLVWGEEPRLRADHLDQFTDDSLQRGWRFTTTCSGGGRYRTNRWDGPSGAWTAESAGPRVPYSWDPRILRWWNAGLRAPARSGPVVRFLRDARG